MALTVLSATRTESIIDMIDKGDVKGLTKLPKIGKKTAEQIILSLKGKLVLEEDSPAAKKDSTSNEVVSALVNLGFAMNDVEMVVGQMDTIQDLQDGVRQGLKALTTQL